MTVMYFLPNPDDVAAALASNCPLATPRDPRDCEGSICSSWNRLDNKPCVGYRGRIDYSVQAVMARFRSTPTD
jgi:hypothetical protein